MNRDLAKIKTIEKFTNLLDGSLLPGVSVATVISYYDAMILGTPTNNIHRIDGIVENFIEDYFNSMTPDEL